MQELEQHMVVKDNSFGECDEIHMMSYVKKELRVNLSPEHC